MRRRSRLWVWVVAAAVTLVVLCGVAGYAGYEWLRGPSKGELSEAADAVALPTEYKLIDEFWIGNSLCLDDCYHLYRRYSSPSSMQETYRIYSAALQAAGYRCISFCEGVDAEGRGLDTTWRRASGFTFALRVFPTAKDRAAGYRVSPPLDRSREVHVDVQVW